MTTRRKPGKLRKTQAAPRKKAAASRAHPAPARRVSTKARVSGKSPVSSREHASARGAAPAQSSASAAKPVAFPAECTIVQAPEMKETLARMLGEPGTLTLDLSPIRRVDTAALQVLTTFIRERRAAGRGVECKGASDTFLRTAEVLGLNALFSPVMDDRLAAPAAGNA